MRAVRFDAFGQPPYLAEVPDPEPGHGGVVIKVGATGLCRSDWHGWQGHDPDIVTMPHTPGHEFAAPTMFMVPLRQGWTASARECRTRWWAPVCDCW